MTISRRDLLQAAGASWLLSQLGCPGFIAPDSSSKELMTKQQDPYNAEPRLDRLLESWVTPYEYFYVRSHGNQPVINPDHYALVVEGLVEKPLQMRLEELERMPKATTTALMQCAGNRRGEHSRTKATGGVQWDAGAIGTAEW